MDVRRLDEMQAQGRSIFDTELAVAYYARVSTEKDEQILSLIHIWGNVEVDPSVFRVHLFDTCDQLSIACGFSNR